MKKIALCIVAAMVVCLFNLVPVSAQEDMVTVDNSVFEKPQRPAALFNHDAHNETAEIEECSVCHHVYEDGKLVEDESSEDQRCSDCHAMKAEDGKPGLMKAFHKNCLDCHQSEAKGPVMCGQCHVNSSAEVAEAEEVEEAEEE